MSDPLRAIHRALGLPFMRVVCAGDQPRRDPHKRKTIARVQVSDPGDDEPGLPPQVSVVHPGGGLDGKSFRGFANWRENPDLGDAQWRDGDALPVYSFVCRVCGEKVPRVGTRKLADICESLATRDGYVLTLAELRRMVTPST